MLYMYCFWEGTLRTGGRLSTAGRGYVLSRFICFHVDSASFKGVSNTSTEASPHFPKNSPKKVQKTWQSSEVFNTLRPLSTKFYRIVFLKFCPLDARFSNVFLCFFYEVLCSVLCFCYAFVMLCYVLLCFMTIFPNREKLSANPESTWNFLPRTGWKAWKSAI